MMPEVIGQKCRPDDIAPTHIDAKHPFFINPDKPQLGVKFRTPSHDAAGRLIGLNPCCARPGIYSGNAAKYCTGVSFYIRIDIIVRLIKLQGSADCSACRIPTGAVHGAGFAPTRSIGRIQSAGLIELPVQDKPCFTAAGGWLHPLGCQ